VNWRTAMSWLEYARSANWRLAGGIGLGSYLLGCFTAGYYLVRLRTGQDLRQIGSGSVGARNVSRVLGRTGFLLTLLADFGKGSLAVFAAQRFTGDSRLVALALLAVVAGHIWPAPLRFHGGKGMATALGALLVFDPRLAPVFAALFLGLFILFRRSVLPGLFALAGLPLAALWLGQTPELVVQLSLLAALVLLAHRKNFVEEFSLLASPRQFHSKHNPHKL